MNLKLRTFAGYALAVGAVAIGFGLYLGLSAWVGADLPTFITFYPAVMVAALIGGLGPGLFATALAALAVDCWIQEPRGLFSVGSLRDGVALVMFCCLGVFISTVAHLLRQARRKAAAYDQEQALREIRREKELLADLLEHADQPFAVIYTDGRIGRLNHAYEQLTGYTAAELRGLDWSAKLTPPEWREMEQRKLDELNRTGQPVRYEKEYLRKDGSRVPIELLVHLARDAEGQAKYYYAFLTDITERRRADERLYLLSAAVESAASGIVITDSKGTVLWVNPAFSKLTGYSQTEAVGQNRRVWESDQHPPEFYRGMWETVLGGGVWRGELISKRKDGSLYSEEMTITPVRQAGGDITHFIAIKQDITVRKRIEDTHDFLSHCGYQASGEDFFHALARYLAQSLGMDFVCIDRLAGDGLAAQTVAVFFDGKFEDNLTYALKDTPCGAVVGETICCFPKDVRHLFPKDAVLQGMKAESYVGTTLWSYDGKAIGLIAVIGRRPLADPRLAESVLKLVAGRVAGELQHQEAEDALRRARDELELRVQERTARLDRTNQRLRHAVRVRREAERRVKEAEVRYRTVADFTYDWEYWKTPEGLLLYCSPSCERVTGYTAAELAVSPELLVQMVYPQDRDNWRQHESEAMTRPAPRTIVFRIQRKSGELRWIEHTCQPVIGSQGKFLGLRASNRDITDRKAEEQQTQQLRVELARVTRVTTASQFAASLAHELNQPLTAILSNAQTAQVLLAADPPDVAEVREALGDIEHDSERASRVIQRLRALFKKTGQERNRLQLNDLIEETLDLLRSEFVLKGIGIRIHLEPTLPEILGDRVGLQQVVLNLVVNAMEAMSECEPAQRQLEIATGCEGPAQIRASVRDSGPGIRVEPISRLFEPFFTTKANGMGMGLAISHSIMEAHDGSLGAANNPDRGATFHLTLPIHPGGEA